VSLFENQRLPCLRNALTRGWMDIQTVMTGGNAIPPYSTAALDRNRIRTAYSPTLNGIDLGLGGNGRI